MPKYFPTVLAITRDLHGSLVLRFLPILLCLSQIWTDFKEATEQTKGSPHLLLLHCQSSNLPTRANPSFSNQHQMNNCKLSTFSKQQAGSKFHTVFNHDKETSVHCCRHLVISAVYNHTDRVNKWWPMTFIYSYNQTSNLSADELSVKVWVTLA